MRAISLFSGAGGLDLGCEEAGFKTVAAVEFDERACSTLLENAERFFPNLRQDRLFRDILQTSSDNLLNAIGADEGEIDLVHGGPPCTPFSKSGYWLEYKRAGADPKATLVDEFVRVVDGTRPKSFLMENVYGLAYRNQNRAVLNRFVEGVQAAGYSVDLRVLLAADFGVPQLRQRLICVGLRNDLLGASARDWRLEWPTPTHAGPHETRKTWDQTLPLHRTAGEALAGLPEERNPPEPEEEVDGTYAEELHGVPSGENYLYWTERRGHPEPRFAWRSRYWNFLLKLHPDRPSPTIQGQPGPWVGPFHWNSRRLRVGEVKRLMTFPDEFIVLGSRRDQQLQLGNAVPPVFASAVAGALRETLLSLECPRRERVAAAA